MWRVVCTETLSTHIVSTTTGKDENDSLSISDRGEHFFSSGNAVLILFPKMNLIICQGFFMFVLFQRASRHSHRDAGVLHISAITSNNQSPAPWVSGSNCAVSCLISGFLFWWCVLKVSNSRDPSSIFRPRCDLQSTPFMSQFYCYIGTSFMEAPYLGCSSGDFKRTQFPFLFKRKSLKGRREIIKRL